MKADFRKRLEAGRAKGFTLLSRLESDADRKFLTEVLSWYSQELAAGTAPTASHIWKEVAADRPSIAKCLTFKQFKFWICQHADRTIDSGKGKESNKRGNSKAK